MRILVVGAGGFVGRHIVSELLSNGHVPIGAVRRPADFAEAFPGVAMIPCDLARDHSTADWLPRLDGADLVVNAASVPLLKNIPIVAAVMCQGVLRSAR